MLVAVLKTLLKLFCLKIVFFWPKFQGRQKKRFFLTIVVLQNVPLGTLNALLTTPLKLSEKNRCFLMKIRNSWKNYGLFIEKCFFSRVSFRYVESRFGNRSKKSSAKGKTILHSVWWNDETSFFHSKLNQYFPWTQWK